VNEANTKALMEAGPTIFRRGDERSPFSLFYFECGDGWFELLLDLVRKLEPLALAPEGHDVMEGRPIVQQVKEKFGSLRFYISHGTDEMYALIHEAEHKSAETCETCGQPGEIKGKGWLRCTCLGCETHA